MAKGPNAIANHYVVPVTNFTVEGKNAELMERDDIADVFKAEMSILLPRCLSGGACTMVVEATKRDTDLDAAFDCGVIRGETNDAADQKETHCLAHHERAITEAAEMLAEVAVVINRPYEIDASNL